MKIIYKNRSILLITILLLITSCSFDEPDLTENPNKNTTQVPPQLFTNALLKTLNMHGKTMSSSPSGTLQLMLPSIYVQQLNSGTNYKEVRYANLSNSDAFEYNDYYNALYTLKIIQKYIRNENNRKTVINKYGDIDNIYNVSEVLSVYLWQFITDTWGDVPYFEALQGADKFDAKFDRQQDIYTDLFKRLNDAILALSKSSNKNLFIKDFLNQDLYFKGNIDKWILFANSLRATMAMRIRNVDTEKAKIEFTKAFNSGLIQSNSDNLYYNFNNPFNPESYSSLSSQNNPWYILTKYWFKENLCLSSTFVDFLKHRNDERLFAYAEKAEDLSSNNTGFDAYVGLGYNYAEELSISEKAVSTLNKKNVRSKDTPIYFYTFAQICFLKAEAAKLGWISGNAQTFYEEGVKASMNQWGITNDTDIITYLQGNNVKWNDTKAFELIGEQMYIALYTQGFEAWFNWRRTGYPKLMPVSNAVDKRDIPRRYHYPENEKSFNTKNYTASLSVQGEDTYHTRVWWDIKK